MSASRSQGCRLPQVAILGHPHPLLPRPACCHPRGPSPEPQEPPGDVPGMPHRHLVPIASKNDLPGS